MLARPRMKPLPFLLPLLAVAGALRAGDNVPAFSITDTYDTSPTMLVRAGANGDIREIWSGMDAKRMRHVPLFLETSIHCEVRNGDAWSDLRDLKYHQVGTHPGYIHLKSDDGLVEIETGLRKGTNLRPIFLRYSFSKPVEVRLTADFKHPEFTQEARSSDAQGSSVFTTLWRGVNATLATTEGPRLVLATMPTGRTVSVGKGGLVKDIGPTSGLLLCIDATEEAIEPAGAETFLQAWLRVITGRGDLTKDLPPDVVTLTSDDAKLDNLFKYSIDAIETHQFASGDVMADVFFYRDSWLRDGTYTMIGLSLAGDYAAVSRYFAFWNAQRDFSVGGEREAQQAAIAVTGMWYYSLLNPEGPAFLANAWPYVQYYGDYYAKRVAKEGMLNLAEEWICFLPAPSSWPNAEVYSGLRAAAKIAVRLGHAQEAERWGGAADKLQARFSEQAYDKDKGRIIPIAGKQGEFFKDPDFPGVESHNGPMRDDRVDAGMLIIGRLEAFGKGQGIVSVDDPRFASTQAEVIRDLENPDHSIFRFGPNPANPHAPKGELDTWPIIMSWAAQDEWLLGRTDLAWRYLLSGIVNKQDYDLQASNYYLPEFWDRKGIPDKPLIVWSHGDFVTSTLLLLLGVDLEPKEADLGLAPSLPPKMNHAHLHNFRFRDWRLNIDLNRDGNHVVVDVEAANPNAGNRALAIRLPTGKLVSLNDAQQTRFIVDPSQYPLEFGRSANAAERASIISRVLNGKDAPADMAKRTLYEQQVFISNVETGYQPGAK